MSLSLGSLAQYTNQLVKPLLTSAVFDGKTQQLIKDNGIVIPNAKSVVAIPLIDTDAVFQTDSCSYDPSGTTSFTQRNITVGRIKIEETICPKDLELYFTQLALKSGSTYSDFGNSEFQAMYLEKKNKRIASQLETCIWQGDITGATTLNKFDGLQKQIATGSVDANVSGFTGVATISTITQSNVIAATEGIQSIESFCIQSTRCKCRFIYPSGN